MPGVARHPAGHPAGRHRLLGSLAALLLGTALLLATFATAKGQSAGPNFEPSPLLNGPVLNLTNPSLTNPEFLLQMRTGDLSRFGTIPVRFTGRSVTGPFQDDRRLTVRIEAPGDRTMPEGRGTVYELALQIPRGETSFQQDAFLPKWFLDGKFYVSLWEGSTRLEGYSGEMTAPQMQLSSSASAMIEPYWIRAAEGQFGWIASPGHKPIRLSAASDMDADDLRMLMTSLAPDLIAAPSISDPDENAALINGYGPLAQLAYFTIEELPSDYRGYQRCHVWVTTWETLQALKSQRPDADAALRKHLQLGGLLWLVRSPDPNQVAQHFGTRFLIDDPPPDETIDEPPADAQSPDAARSQANPGQAVSGQAVSGQAVSGQESQPQSPAPTNPTPSPAAPDSSPIGLDANSVGNSSDANSGGSSADANSGGSSADTAEPPAEEERLSPLGQAVREARGSYDVETGEIRLILPASRPIGSAGQSSYPNTGGTFSGNLSSGGSSGYYALSGGLLASGPYLEGNIRRHAELDDFLRFRLGRLPTERQIAANLDWVRQPRPPFKESDLRSVPIGLGSVLCCNRDDSFPGSFEQWQTMLLASGAGTSVVLRRGFDPVMGDSRFWNWTIRGVAQPPIYAFLSLIALFMLLVGPIAYWKLRSIGRSYLMFLVAPLLAMLATAALVVYGLVADGLGTKARVREVTWLCDADGNAARYCRSTYFTGLRPVEGLRFPPEAIVEPYRADTPAAWRQRGNNEPEQAVGTIRLEPDALRLSSDFFPSRQQRQFVAFQPVEKIGGLRLRLPQGASAPEAELISELKLDLNDLIVRDAAGEYWSADRIEAGRTLKPIKLTETEAAKKLGEIYARQTLAPPPLMVRATPTTSGISPDDMTAQLVTCYPYRASVPTARAGMPEADIEWWLREHLQTATRLPRESFIALADVTEDCVAAPGSKLVDSIHYVIGALR
jgi:hypothetical protein